MKDEFFLIKLIRSIYNYIKTHRSHKKSPKQNFKSSGKRKKHSKHTTGKIFQTLFQFLFLFLFSKENGRLFSIDLQATPTLILRFGYLNHVRGIKKDYEDSVEQLIITAKFNYRILTNRDFYHLVAIVFTEMKLLLNKCNNSSPGLCCRSTVKLTYCKFSANITESFQTKIT